MENQTELFIELPSHRFNNKLAQNHESEAWVCAWPLIHFSHLYMDSYFAPDNEEFHETKLSLARFLRLWPSKTLIFRIKGTFLGFWYGIRINKHINQPVIPAGLKDEQMFWWIFLSPWWCILVLFSFLLKTSKTHIPSTLLSHDPISTYSGDL